MAISWNSRTIADAYLRRIHGARMAGGYRLTLGVDFSVSNWGEGPPPLVIMTPARVSIGGPTALFLGYAQPEVIQPFTVTPYASNAGIQFDLPLTPTALEAVERHRNGQDLAVTINLRPEIRQGSQVQHGWEDLTATFNLSQWVAALEQAGYGRSLIFEVPIPDEPADLGSAIDLLGAARRLLASGHYSDVVAKCRMVLERQTQQLNQDQALKVAREQTRGRDRTALERELMMRQAAMDFAHLAHHPTDVALDETFDRNAAQMMLGVTAALVSSAMSRRAAAERAS